MIWRISTICICASALQNVQKCPIHSPKKSMRFLYWCHWTSDLVLAVGNCQFRALLMLPWKEMALSLSLQCPMLCTRKPRIAFQGFLPNGVCGPCRGYDFKMHCSKVTTNTTRIVISVEADLNVCAICTVGSGVFCQGRKLQTSCCTLSGVFPTKGTSCRAVYCQDDYRY